MEKRRWAALIYRLSSLPSRNRVYVWRKLKEVGAVYSQQGVAVLPSNPQTVGFLQGLRGEILGFGGEAAVAELDFLNEDEEEKIVETFRANASKEYGEVEEDFSRLLGDFERTHKIATLEYFEQTLSAMRKKRNFLEKIESRDYFHATIREKLERQAERSIRRVACSIREIKKKQRDLY